MGSPDAKYRVPAVVGAINVLGELSGISDQGLTQSDLVERTGLSKSTMHNLLSTLEGFDFVRREPESRFYRLGPALIPLGTAATSQVKLVRYATDRLAPLASAHKLSFAVAQRTAQNEARIIERFYPLEDVHVGVTIGSRYGPMDGAIGKVLLAAMEPGHAHKVIKSRKLPAHTQATITSPETLVNEITDVRSRGWSTSHGEFNENNAVASGVWGPRDELELILLALGFPGQLNADRLEEIGALLKGVAEDVMTAAGGRAPAADPVAD